MILLVCGTAEIEIPPNGSARADVARSARADVARSARADVARSARANVARSARADVARSPFLLKTEANPAYRPRLETLPKFSVSIVVILNPLRME